MGGGVGTAKVETGCAACWVRRAEGEGCPFVPRKRHAGEAVYIEGESAERVWMIKSGAIVLRHSTVESEGFGKALAMRQSGSLIGLEALTRSHYRCTAIAAAKATLCAIPAADFDDWLGAHDAPARLALIASIESTDRDVLDRSASGTALQRVACWLRDHGEDRLSLELPRRIVADLLGMCPETLSRSLSRLAHVGAIELTRTTVEILDHGCLESVVAGRLVPASN